MLYKFLKSYFHLSEVQTKRLKANFTSKSLVLFFKIVVQFLFPPLMIFVWGVENFGIWIFLLSLPNLLNMINFNFIFSAKQDMIYYYNQNNSEKVKAIFQCSYFLTLFTITILLALSVLFYFFSDFNFKAIENIPLKLFKNSFIIIVTTVCLTIFDGLFITVLSLKGRFYIVEYIQMIFDGLLKISLILSGFLSDNFFIMVLICFSLKIIQTISYFFLYNKKKEYLELSFIKISKKELFRQAKISVSYNIQIITEVVNNSGLLFVIGIFFNASSVAIVSTCKTLLHHFPRQFFATLNQTIFYEYTFLFANNKFEDLKYNFKKHIKLILIGVAIFAPLSIAFGPLIYKVWMSSKLDVNYSLIYLIILIAICEIIFLALTLPQKSVNQFFKIIFLQFIMSVITLIISSYLFYLSLPFITYFYIFLIFNMFLTVYTIFHVKNFFTLQFKIHNHEQ